MRCLLLTLGLFMPVLTQAQATFDSLTLIHSSLVYFDFGKSDLRPRADTVLDEVLTWWQQDDRLTVHLTAHTDAIGQNKSNQELSQQRAQSVRDALMSRGIADTSLVIETFGENLPVADNDSESGRQLNRRVSIDLYRSRPMRYLEGQIKDEISGEGIQADIVLHGKEFRDSLSTDTLGKFRHPVPDNEVIAADVYAEDHFFETQMFKVQDGVQLEMALPPATEGAAADIENLYFKGNEAVLLPRSEPILPKVLRFMEVNPNLKIEIAGHINRPNSPAVAKDSWDWQLSIARAKLVYDYLLENNIDSSRISFQGYGNTQMRYPYARSEQEQSLNRRVEIRVLGSDR